MKKITIVAVLLTLLIPVSSAEATTKSLNTKNNKNSCKFIKTKYQSEVMLNWATGIATDEDMLKETTQNIAMLSKREKLTSGAIKNVVKTWIVSEQNTKIALQSKNLDAVIKSVELKISSVAKFDKLCRSIKA
jgi:hypothetical protein